MFEPMYRVEMTPIRDHRNPKGGGKLEFPISGRVLENYRDSQIGQFWLGKDGLPHIAVYIQTGSEDRTVDSGRLDPAIHAIWQEYFKSLTFRERWARRLFAHRAWLATLIVGLISSSIVLLADDLWGFVGDTLPIIQQQLLDNFEPQKE